MDYWSVDDLNPLPGTLTTNASSKLAAKDAALSTCLFDADLHAADPGVRKFLADFAPDFTGDVFRQQLRAGIDEGQKNHILARQQQPLGFVAHLNFFAALVYFDSRARGLNQRAMIQRVAHLLDQRLEGNEIEHDSGVVDLSLKCHRHLIVMAVQRLPLTIRENEKMSRGEIEIIFGDLNAEKT